MGARALLGAIGLSGLVGLSLLLGVGLLAGGFSSNGAGHLGSGLASTGGHLVPVKSIGTATSGARGLSHLPLEYHAQSIAGHAGSSGAATPGYAPTTYVPMKHCDMQAHWAILSGSTVTS
jgi:hypothetical protein